MKKFEQRMENTWIRNRALKKLDEVDQKLCGKTISVKSMVKIILLADEMRAAGVKAKNIKFR